MSKSLCPDDGEDVRALVRALVALRTMSQQELAYLIGTSQSRISSMERGASSPSLSLVMRYARAVGCRLALEVVNEEYLDGFVVSGPADLRERQ